MVGSASDNKTTLSVIMPAFNAQATIHRSISSTLKAMPESAELLVYVDGPIEPEYAFDRIQDVRLKVLYGDQPRGISFALNALIEEARGTYVARMDADDVCLPNRFKKQLAYIEMHDVDFVFMNAVLFGSGVKPFGVLPQPPVMMNPEAVAFMLPYANPLVHPTMFTRRETLVSLGGYGSAVAEDYALWLKASLRGLKIVRLSGFGILYRYHAGQLSQQKSVREGWKADKEVLELISSIRTKFAEQFDTSDTYLDSVLRAKVASQVRWFNFQYGVFGHLVETARKTFLRLG